MGQNHVQLVPESRDYLIATWLATEKWGLRWRTSDITLDIVMLAGITVIQFLLLFFQ